MYGATAAPYGDYFVIRSKCDRRLPVKLPNTRNPREGRTSSGVKKLDSSISITGDKELSM